MVCGYSAPVVMPKCAREHQPQRKGMGSEPKEQRSYMKNETKSMAIVGFALGILTVVIIVVLLR